MLSYTCIFIYCDFVTIFELSLFFFGDRKVVWPVKKCCSGNPKGLRFRDPTKSGVISKNRLLSFMGYWHRGLMRGMATLPQGNQELLVVRDKVGRRPGELGVSKSMECGIFPFSALTLLVG